jgi:putative DNA primase/helicase
MVVRMLNTTDLPLSFAATASTLAELAEDVAEALLGEPSFTSRHERRWGRRGSLSLRCSGPKRGFWFDHESGKGGDLLSLIARERNVRLTDALAIAYEMLGGVVVPPVVRPKAIARGDNALARTAHAVALWQETTPLNGTQGEHYLVQHRRLAVADLRLDHALRWHGRIGALVALMTDPASGEPIGIHRTFLNADGTKRERKMLGRQGVVRLSPDDMISSGLGITEGIEDGLAVLLSGWSPVWAATSAGAIARLPVLTGIETLTIFADADEPGLRAAQTCSARWCDASREVSIASPRVA